MNNADRDVRDGTVFTGLMAAFAVFNSDRALMTHGWHRATWAVLAVGGAAMCARAIELRRDGKRAQRRTGGMGL